MYICAPQKGRVAEWLGRGLQNLVRRFESVRDLKLKLYNSSNYRAFLISDELLLKDTNWWNVQILKLTQLLPFGVVNVKVQLKKDHILKFKQVFGFVLLIAFLGFMAYKFNNNLGASDDALMITLLSIIIVLLIIVFVVRILIS